MPSGKVRHEPACMLAHELINKVSVVIGFCNLLEEELNAKARARVRTHLAHIRTAAEEMNRHLVEHQRKVIENAS